MNSEAIKKAFTRSNGSRRRALNVPLSEEELAILDRVIAEDGLPDNRAGAMRCLLWKWERERKEGGR